ncbi:MAG: orotidine-5'-phosphate decarboxylase [Candidatus Staskawiczbacteria bacterium]|nr:orotidine-5'-phosphate decarboxylase [Candidatus Staskawiczbacteria bacterium]
MKNAKDMIWVAVDVSTQAEAIGQIKTLVDNGIRRIKLGLELLSTGDRESVIHFAQLSGCEVFYDGKFDDIPHTVGAAAKVVASRGVAMFNVHASAGRKAMEAAVANKGQSNVLVVTLLTSLSKEDLRDLGYPESISKDVVVRAMASCAAECKVDGIICSAQEAQLVRSVMPQGMIVTPAIRPVWAVVGDQKRPTTPTDAIKAGATDLVIGRPITNPPPEIGSPTEALKRIVDEIAEAMQVTP